MPITSTTAVPGLFFGSRPQRSSVSRTPGKSCQSASEVEAACSMLSLALATSAIFSAWANATWLAWEKSEGWKMDSTLT